MPDGREHIPVAVQRRVKEEAGYRCAIPRCGSTAGLQIAHIEPYTKSRDNSFENLILLCANDHARYDIDKAIAVQSIRVFKANLGVISSRYNDFERRLLETLYERGSESSVVLEFSDTTALLVRNLARDGIIEHVPANGPATYRTSQGQAFQSVGGTFNITDPDRPVYKVSPEQRETGRDAYSLTAKGQDLTRRLFTAELID